MAARSKKIRHDQETRLKIQASQIINRLTNHVLGNIELSSTQVTAALGLLRKAIPDLAAVQHSGQIEVKRASEMTDDELSTIASGRGESASTSPIDPSQLN
jgi:hypothetical protein